MTNEDRAVPSTTSIALATAILSFASGYFIASFSSIFSSSPSAPSTSTSRKSKEKKSWPNSYDVTIHPDSSDEELMSHLNGDTKANIPGREVPDSEDSSDAASEEEDEEAQGELSPFKGNNEECKLVLVVRQDLGMGKGKMAAQCSHATLACYTALSASSTTKHPLLKRWERLGQAKIVTQAASEEELLALQAQALSLGLCARVVRDAGRTQVASGTATVLGVGPGPRSVVDQVTGGLKLL